jgi:hypothetical protein
MASTIHFYRGVSVVLLIKSDDSVLKMRENVFLINLDLSSSLLLVIFKAIRTIRTNYEVTIVVSRWFNRL